MANYNHNRKLFQSAMQEVHQRDEKIQSLYGDLKENTNINNPQLLNEIIGSLLLGAAVAAPVVAAGYNIYKTNQAKKAEEKRKQAELDLAQQRHRDDIAARQAETAARTAASQAQTAESQADRAARIEQAKEDREARTQQAEAERKSRETITGKQIQSRETITGQQIAGKAKEGQRNRRLKKDLVTNTVLAALAQAGVIPGTGTGTGKRKGPGKGPGKKPGKGSGKGPSKKPGKGPGKRGKP